MFTTDFARQLALRLTADGIRVGAGLQRIRDCAPSTSGAEEERRVLPGDEL